MSEENQEAIETAEEVNLFATVGAVYSDGISLIFDSQIDEGQTEKRYKANTSVKFSAGDRVKLVKDSGTYVVEYVVGTPFQDILIPTGGTDGQYLSKNGSSNYALKWVTPSNNGIPTGGTTGQYLKKKSNTDYDSEWADIEIKGVLPTGGTVGQVLTKSGSSDYSVNWTTLTGFLPSGGTTGQFLKKSSSTNYAVEWSNFSTDELYVSGTNKVTLNSSRQLVPHASSSTYAYSLGSSAIPWYSLYVGAGNIHLGTSASKLGFFGATDVARQAISLTSNNMGYSSVTTNNYIYAINNVIGILKKYGLIS